jgi:hypothetical protein
LGKRGELRRIVRDRVTGLRETQLDHLHDRDVRVKDATASLLNCRNVVAVRCREIVGELHIERTPFGSGAGSPP